MVAAFSPAKPLPATGFLNGVVTLWDVSRPRQPIPGGLVRRGLTQAEWDADPDLPPYDYRVLC
ncbi:hypothetical protein SAMN05421507_102553 [Lentzea jiangxiensis]|uniref:Uncharacterized protein n=1 Tax=Lentzea jiangxiensis TaxID=641025 RepID=A0A1H0JM23_9PSEU|nr:hypothetical protein SAMN05421507_102553 [Lentzea jiangxiensis]